jgi:diguanylate cyclase (GGDEF)-like protein/PAS domain S-box-containing protein
MSSLRANERRFEELVANSSDLIAVLNDRAELVYANPAGERVLGLVPDDYVGKNMLDLVHPDDRERAAQAFKGDLSVPGVHPSDVYRFRSLSDEWRFLEVTANNCLAEPSIAGIVINTRDVTDSTNLARAFRTLSNTNHVLLNATDETSLLAQICAAIVEAGNYSVAWVGYIEHDEACSVRVVAATGRTGYVDDICVSWGDNKAGQGPFALAVRSGRPEVAVDVRKTNVPPENQDAAIRYGLRAVCVLPLRVGSEVIGALAIYADEAGAFGVEEVALLAELADALAYGIGRIRDASRLEQVESDFRLLAETAPIGILEVAAVASVVYANPKFAEIVGEPIESLLGRGWVDFIYPDDLPGLQSLIDGPYTRRESAITTFRIRRRGGEIRHVRMRAAPKGESLEDGDVVTIEDVTEEVRAREELAHHAFYDTLTGLPNRALFLDRLNQELARRRRGSPQIAVLFLDLDRFKIVNDSLGHEAGDAVLKELGDRFMDAVRGGETAARFSGDEFVFIVRDVHEVQDSVAAANRLLGLLESPIHCAGQELTVTGSIGIVIPSTRADSAIVLRDVETAMYQAKKAGRNTFALFDEDLHLRSVARLEMESELRRALDRHEFEVYYQPVVELKSGRPVAAEALLRWNHPTRGLVPPLEFIPVAEETGLIGPIGQRVFEQAVSQLAAWDLANDGPRLDVIAINLSVRQLDDPEIVGMVRDVLERCGIAAGRVALEVTESVIMADSESTRRSLERFTELGLGVAIDDFGTGYSSLAHLHALPVTTVKIDRSFIERLGGEQDSTPVVKAIVEMSHAMGLRVVAEGVSEERLKWPVSAMGCDLAQGFYWARPMPAQAFADWWRDAELRAVDPPSVSKRLS